MNNFWRCNGPKKVKLMMKLFWSSTFGIFDCCTENNWNLWNYVKRLDNICVFFKDFFLIWPNLTWPWHVHGPIWKCMSPSNYASQMTHKTYVTQYSCIISISWLNLTPSWSWTLLSLRSICRYMHLLHLLGTFGKVCFRSWVISPAYETKSDDFDLWPELDLACET